MSLDDVDIQILLLDRVAAARAGAHAAPDQSVEDAVAGALGA